MRIRTFLGGAPFLAVLIGGLTALGAGTSVVPEPGDLRTAGTVDFPVSCAPAARAEFIRGVALLHSFFYEEARRIFTDVAAEGSNLCHGAMGNRHDVVASDLDASDSRRNARRQGGSGQGHGNDGWHRSRAAIYHGTERLLQHAGWSHHGRGRTVLSRAGGTARPRGRV